ncbi:hypothetical protein STEG23_019175 [Scotinomys teguina]
MYGSTTASKSLGLDPFTLSMFLSHNGKQPSVPSEKPINTPANSLNIQVTPVKGFVRFQRGDDLQVENHCPRKCGILYRPQKCGILYRPQKCGILYRPQKCEVLYRPQKCGILYHPQKCGILYRPQK